MFCVFILHIFHCSINNHLNKVLKIFLFSVYNGFVGSGSVSIDTDPDRQLVIFKYKRRPDILNPTFI